MNKNKILVRIIVPELDKHYDVLLPIGKKIGNIAELLNKSIFEIKSEKYKDENIKCLYNKDTGVKYDLNSILYETDIRNDSELILI